MLLFLIILVLVFGIPGGYVYRGGENNILGLFLIIVALMILFGGGFGYFHGGGHGVFAF